MNFVQVVPFRDLQRAILQGERIVASLPDGPERDTIVSSVKENLARLTAGRPLPSIVA